MNLEDTIDLSEGIVYIILNQRYCQGIKISRHFVVFWAYCGRLERNMGCFDEDLDLDPIFMIQKLYNFGLYLKEFCFLICKMEVAITSTSQGCFENQRR